MKRYQFSSAAGFGFIDADRAEVVDGSLIFSIEGRMVMAFASGHWKSFAVLGLPDATPDQ